MLRPNCGFLAARVRTTQPLTERTSNPAVPFPSELEKEDPRFPPIEGEVSVLSEEKVLRVQRPSNERSESQAVNSESWQNRALVPVCESSDRSLAPVVSPASDPLLSQMPGESRILREQPAPGLRQLFYEKFVSCGSRTCYSQREPVHKRPVFRLTSVLDPESVSQESGRNCARNRNDRQGFLTEKKRMRR